MKDLKSEILNINHVISLAEDRNFNSFYFFGERIIHHGVIDQVVSLPNKEDLDLIKSSVLFFGMIKRECMQVRVHTITGQVFCSKVIKGNRNSVSSKGEIQSIIRDLSHKVRRDGLEIDHVELAHTHLGDQVVKRDSTGSLSVTTRALSEQDLRTTAEIKEFIKSPIKIKAVTEQNLSYERLVS